MVALLSDADGITISNISYKHFSFSSLLLTLHWLLHFLTNPTIKIEKVLLLPEERKTSCIVKCNVCMCIWNMWASRVKVFFHLFSNHIFLFLIIASGHTTKKIIYYYVDLVTSLFWWWCKAYLQKRRITSYHAICVKDKKIFKSPTLLIIFVIFVFLFPSSLTTFLTQITTKSWECPCKEKWSPFGRSPKTSSFLFFITWDCCLLLLCCNAKH